LVAVRWQQLRIYPIEFHESNTNTKLGGIMGTVHETEEFLRIFNIADQRA
jgi:hypothetical protein